MSNGLLHAPQEPGLLDYGVTMSKSKISPSSAKMIFATTSTRTCKEIMGDRVVSLLLIVNSPFSGLAAELTASTCSARDLEIPSSLIYIHHAYEVILRPNNLPCYLSVRTGDITMYGQNYGQCGILRGALLHSRRTTNPPVRERTKKGL